MAGIFVLPLLFSSCKDDESTATMPPQQQGERWSKLSVIQKKVFTPYCAIPSCHALPNPASNLNLDTGKAYSNLYRIKSILSPSYYRVEPLKPSQSILYTVLNNGSPILMPLSGKIHQAYIDSIAVWIQSGAANN
jgi:hypothetical protein